MIWLLLLQRAGADVVYQQRTVNRAAAGVSVHQLSSGRGVSEAAVE